VIAAGARSDVTTTFNPALLIHHAATLLLPGQVAVQANSATGREKAQLESRAQKAKAKLDAARGKAESVERAPLPKIEVSAPGIVMSSTLGWSPQQDPCCWLIT
jgi:hypothetical protein